MKNYALLVLVATLGLLNFGCDKCENIECTTPPPEFSFQLMDKDSGQDLVANSTIQPKKVKVFSIADNKLHSLFVSTPDSISYFFTDQEMGWETGSKNASYELRLNDTLVFSFIYETKSVEDGCCSSIKLEKFEMEGLESLFIPQRNLFQFRL